MIVEVKIDYNKCQGCKECVKTCTFGVLEWLDDQPIVINPNKCAKCFECIEKCPSGAITIREQY
ncbi:MAG: 4Fe-4S binding protein [Promethearchaeota archaeon]